MLTFFASVWPLPLLAPVRSLVATSLTAAPLVPVPMFRVVSPTVPVPQLFFSWTEPWSRVLVKVQTTVSPLATAKL